MAGTIIADYIRTDANKLSLNVGNTTFATINSGGFYSNTGTQIIAANGTVSTSALSGTIIGSQIQTGAITYDKMAITGEVIQVVSAYASLISITTGTPTDVVTLNITTKKANSKLYMSFSGDCNADATGAWKYFGFYLDGVQQTRHITSIYNASYQDGASAVGLTAAVSQGTHTVALKSWQGAGTSTWAEDGNCQLVVMEISA